METLSEALASHIVDNTSLELGSSLMFGEMIRGMSGVFIVDEQTGPPNIYQKSLEDHVILFWGQSADAKQAWDWLNEIYELFHIIENIQISDWYIFLSRADTQIQDMDRDIEGFKLWQVRIDVTCAYNELVS